MKVNENKSLLDSLKHCNFLPKNEFLFRKYAGFITLLVDLTFVWLYLKLSKARIPLYFVRRVSMRKLEGLFLRAFFHNDRAVRMIPNTPSVILRSFTIDVFVVCAGHSLIRFCTGYSTNL